jgi:flavin reductase (DIM6/NTAB) family NADH-FMN oxidoreductase RutF
VNTSALRRALGMFCTGVTVITAEDPATGAPRGMTANAFMSGSLEPPLLVIGVQTNAKFHAVVTAAQAYGVSVLGEAAEHHARRFAGLAVSGHEPDPVFEWHGRVPVLAGGVAWFVASVVGRHAIGDHTLFIGHADEFGVCDGEAPPLSYHRSGFARLVPASPALPIDPWGRGGLDLWG